jgi:DNA-directed RNA polymerase
VQKEGRNVLRRRDDPVDDADNNVRFAVTNLRNTLSKVADTSLPRERQIALEKASYDAAQAEMVHAYEQMAKLNSGGKQDPTVLQRQRLQSWMYEWHGALRSRLATDMAAVRSALDATAGQDVPAPPGPGRRALSVIGLKDQSLALYLTLLPVDRLALITVIEIMRQCGGHGVMDGMKALRAMLAVGKAVETEYRAETIRNVAGTDSPQWLRTLDAQTQKPTPALVGSVWRKLGKQLEEGESLGETSAQGLNKSIEDDLRAVWTPPWSQMAHLGVGDWLVTRLLDEAVVSRRGTDPETGEEM